MRKHIIILLIVIALLQAADATTTHYALQNGYEEANPLARHFQPFDFALLIRAPLFAATAALVLSAEKSLENSERGKRIITWALTLFAGANALVVLNNSALLLGLRF